MSCWPGQGAPKETEEVCPMSEALNAPRVFGDTGDIYKAECYCYTQIVTQGNNTNEQSEALK